MLLRAVTEEALGRKLTPREGKALRMAHRLALETAQREGRVADIRDVLAALPSRRGGRRGRRAHTPRPQGVGP